MRGLSAIEAGKVIGVTHTSIHNYVKRGLLPARHQGPRKIIRIDAEDLRKFAEQYEFVFDEAVLQGLTVEK